MPAPFWSGTFALWNSTLTMVVVALFGVDTTQVPLPCALTPSAKRRARPPMPQIVMLLARQVVASAR
jgi:hypothetical protein